MNEGNAESGMPLGGGEVTDGVWLVDRTVRRPNQPWTATAHRLLEHLDAQGFNGSPRPLGIDSRNREILTFHEGHTMTSGATSFPAPFPVDRIGAFVRRFHDMASSFSGDPEPVWGWEGHRDPEGGPLILHGDLAPWNLFVTHGKWVLLDWDTIGPGRAEWELGYVLLTFVPLWANTTLSVPEQGMRILDLSRGYGLGVDGIECALRLVSRRCQEIAKGIQRSASQGDIAFIRKMANGSDQRWNATATHADRLLPAWLRYVERNRGA